MRFEIICQGGCHKVLGFIWNNLDYPFSRLTIYITAGMFEACEQQPLCFNSAENPPVPRWSFWSPLSLTVLHSAVGNVSGYRWEADCRSRGHEFDPGPVSYFSGDWAWNNFYDRSPTFRWIIHEGLLLVTSKNMCTNHWLTACSSLPRKKVCLGELTVPPWP